MEPSPPPKTQTVVVSIAPKTDRVPKPDPKVASPPIMKVGSPPVMKIASQPVAKVISPPANKTVFSPPKVTSPPAMKAASQPAAKVTSPPTMKIVYPPAAKVASPPVSAASVVSPPSTKVSSPATNVFPMNNVASPIPPAAKVASPPVAKLNRSDSKVEDKYKEACAKKAEPVAKNAPVRNEKLSLLATEVEKPVENGAADNEDTNGVGNKIKIFEKAAEEAATATRVSRAGSMRRPRTERLPSDELPPPPIVRPEVRPLASPADLTIRSPSLATTLPDRFPSHGTAFRNVTPANSAANTSAPIPVPPTNNEEDEAHSAFKSCKTKPKERDRYSVSRGSSYFTRGSEEIWLVKKKDIEEIEERVLESFRRGAATLGRGSRRQYVRSESMEAGGAARAHTLRRQASVACTCNHDKRTRARSADTPPRTTTPDDSLDKYETLV